MPQSMNGVEKISMEIKFNVFCQGVEHMFYYQMIQHSLQRFDPDQAVAQRNLTRGEQQTKTRVR